MRMQAAAVLRAFAFAVAARDPRLAPHRPLGGNDEPLHIHFLPLPPPGLTGVLLHVLLRR